MPKKRQNINIEPKTKRQPKTLANILFLLVFRLYICNVTLSYNICNFRNLKIHKLI